jgi:hypothetical protein
MRIDNHPFDRARPAEPCHIGDAAVAQVEQMLGRKDRAATIGWGHPIEPHQRVDTIDQQSGPGPIGRGAQHVGIVNTDQHHAVVGPFRAMRDDPVDTRLAATEENGLHRDTTAIELLLDPVDDFLIEAGRCGRKHIHGHEQDNLGGRRPPFAARISQFGRQSSDPFAHVSADTAGIAQCPRHGADGNAGGTGNVALVRIAVGACHQNPHENLANGLRPDGAPWIRNQIHYAPRLITAQTYLTQFVLLRNKENCA